MKMVLYFILSFAIFTSCVSGDFLSSLDKLDIDTKLREIDKAINAIDSGDDSVIDDMKAKKQKPKTEEDDTDFSSAVEMLAGMISGGECTFKCKNGNKPQPRAEHVPTSDGCGSSGIKIDTDDIPGAEDCCHEHDYCYDTCNSDRTTCDKEFKTCLHDTCNKLKTTKSNNKFSYKDCKGTADLMYSGTLALGCDPFLKAQENACHCRNTPKSGNDKKSNQKYDAKKKSAPSSAKIDKKVKPSQGRRNDEL